MSDALESIEHLWFTARESNLSYRVVDAIESIWSAIGNEDAFDAEREELLGKIEALETKVSTLEDERDRLTDLVDELEEALENTQ